MFIALAVAGTELGVIIAGIAIGGSTSTVVIELAIIVIIIIIIIIIINVATVI